MKDIIRQGSVVTDDKLVIEQIKYQIVADFLGYLQGVISKDKLSSNIDDHLMPVQIMSGIYQSHIKYIEGENPLIKYKLKI